MTDPNKAMTQISQSPTRSNNLSKAELIAFSRLYACLCVDFDFEKHISDLNGIKWQGWIERLRDFVPYFEDVIGQIKAGHLQIKYKQAYPQPSDILRLAKLARHRDQAIHGPNLPKSPDKRPMPENIKAMIEAAKQGQCHTDFNPKAYRTCEWRYAWENLLKRIVRDQSN